MASSLAPADLQKYDEQGFLVVKGLFDAAEIKCWNRRFRDIVEGRVPKAERMVVMKDVMVAMRDGVKLATDIYLPDGEPSPKGPFPAILIRTPYDKSGSAKTAEFFTRSGYAVAVQDVRGRYASEGEFYIYTQEGPDGRDAVEWLAARPPVAEPAPR